MMPSNTRITTVCLFVALFTPSPEAEDEKNSPPVDVIPKTWDGEAETIEYERVPAAPESASVAATVAHTFPLPVAIVSATSKDAMADEPDEESKAAPKTVVLTAMGGVLHTGARSMTPAEIIGLMQ